MINIPTQGNFTNTYGSGTVHEILLNKYGKIYKEYRDQWVLIESMQLETDYPIQLDFELNYSCNFSCAMCTWSNESSRNRGKTTWFDFTLFKEIIDDGVAKGLKVVRLNYINEPLIRGDIYNFISYAKTAGVVDVYFSTNGSLLTAPNIKKLIASGLDRLQVSIDATTADTFNKIRQGGDFNTVTENVLNFLAIRRKLGATFPLLRVNFVKTKLNHHELEEFVKFWESKADGIGIQNLVSIMNEGNGIIKRQTTTFKCSQPFYHLTVRYDGTLLPCCSFFGAEIPVARYKAPKNVTLSNSLNLAITSDDRSLLPRLNIEDTWNSKEMKEFRKMHSDGEYWKNDVCRRCVSSLASYDETV